jgi:MoaA/NifB/PqqE/SkfB family radical SAM enzyme
MASRPGSIVMPSALTASGLATAALLRLGEITHRTFTLPLVIFYPTSRCNSRCASCDWWRASGDTDLRLDEIAVLARSLPALGTRLVAFSGGEPLLRPDVFEAAALFRGGGMTLHLLTSGVLLDRYAADVARHFERVIISLDAASEPLYEAVRGIRALAIVEEGVAHLRRIAPTVRVSGRATLHRLNFRELPRLIDHARAMALDGISFLPADVSSSSAFGRHAAPDASVLALDAEETRVLADLVERTILDHAADFASGFVAESPERLRRLPQYYAALAGRAAFPPVSCNAPWTSVVIEADGAVRPCFFHQSVGNIRTTPLEALLAGELPAFRRGLDLATNPTCERCVCSAKQGWRNAPWT